MATLLVHLMNVSGISCSVKRYSAIRIKVNNLVYKLQHEPACIIDIDFSQLKYKEGASQIEFPLSPNRSFLPPATPQEQSAFLTGLKRLYPTSAILTATFLQSAPQSKKEVPRRLPATISVLYHPKYCKLPQTKLLAECERVFKEMKVSEEEVEYLAEATQLQSESLVWFEHR